MSDQAFYIPAIVRALDPAAFPHDAALIDAQGGLMFGDEALAALIKATGVSLEALFFAAYLVSLALLWAGLVLVGLRVYGRPRDPAKERGADLHGPPAVGVATYLPIAALAAAFTLRHRIPRTSANSFEPYFHPRMLAFAIGVLAVAAVLRRRSWVAVVLVAAAAAVHITTALWFAIVVGVALARLDPIMRRLGIAAALAAIAIGTWALTLGPLAAATLPMDDVWLQAVAGKDSLFATKWPAWAWMANLALLAALVAAHRHRRARGLATDEDEALTWGAAAAVLVFLVTLPAVAAHVAVVVQLQISRVFWLVDFLATVYVIAVLTDPGRVAPATAGVAGDIGDDRMRSEIAGPREEVHSRTGEVPPPPAGTPRAIVDGASTVAAKRAAAPAKAWSAAAVLAGVLVTFSAARGVYILFVEHPERALFDLHLDASPWQDAMQWLQQQPPGVHVLADPGHAWKYGTSVRVAARRDVFQEEVKDASIAMYSRAVAARVVERTRAIGDFGALSAARAGELASQYGLDYLVTPASLPLPLAYENPQFRIYQLRPRGTGGGR